MKKTIRTVAAVVAATALAVVPALSAQAATYSGYIATDANQLTYQYGNSPVTSDGSIQAVIAYSANQVTLVYAADDSQVIVTDTNGDLNYPYYAAFSPDGSTLYVSNYSDDVIVIVDVATASVVDTLTTNNDENLAVGVSPDGTKLVVTDDYDDITVYDIANGYNELSTGGLNDNYNTDVYFIDDTTFYTVGYYGNIQVWDVSDVSSPVDSYTTENTLDAYGHCVTGDLSTLITVANQTVQFSNPADGTEIGSLDLSGDGAISLAMCAVTPDGKKAVVTDWNVPNTPGEGGQVYIVDVATMALDEVVATPDVDYTDGVSVMSDCKVYADGWDENIAIVQLDAVHCILTPNLPDTGASQTLIITLASVGGGLVILGVVAMLIVRRRAKA